MGTVGIATDSNSGITKELADELGIFLVHMSFTINGRVYYEGIDLTQDSFFEKLKNKSAAVSTSQPSPGDLEALWNKALRSCDSLVYIPMSSGLSASCETASVLSEKFDGRVQVVNNHRISVTQYQSVCDALALAKAGYSAVEIKERLEQEAYNSSIYIMVDTLKYLKQGGRITPGAAMIGSVLHLKPVLQIQGDKLDAYAKCRGEKIARRTMLDAIQKDKKERFAAFDEKGELIYHYSYSYQENPANIESWKQEICEEFGLTEIDGAPLTLSVCCHIGPGALAVTCSHRIVP